jgi:hypothetical protein
MENKPYFVETRVNLSGFKLRNITKFNSFTEAVQFAIKYNGVLETPIYNP